MKNQRNSWLSDLNLQKLTLSNTDVLFLIKLPKKYFYEILKFENPPTPPWTLIFDIFIFLIKTFNLYQILSRNKINGI